LATVLMMRRASADSQAASRCWCQLLCTRAVVDDRQASDIPVGCAPTACARCASSTGSCRRRHAGPTNRAHLRNILRVTGSSALPTRPQSMLSLRCVSPCIASVHTHGARHDGQTQARRRNLIRAPSSFGEAAVISHRGILGHRVTASVQMLAATPTATSNGNLPVSILCSASDFHLPSIRTQSPQP